MELLATSFFKKKPSPKQEEGFSKIKITF